MKENIKNFIKNGLTYFVWCLVAAGVIIGICAIINYEGDRIDAARKDREAIEAFHEHEDSVQRAFEVKLYKEWRVKAESLSVDFYNEWMKVKDSKTFAGCTYREGDYDHEEGYTGGKFAGVILCNPHRPVPPKIGNFMIQTVRPQTGELVMIMYSQSFRTIESAVYADTGKVSEDEAQKVIHAFVKGMGLIQ